MNVWLIFFKLSKGIWCGDGYVNFQVFENKIFTIIIKYII